MAARCCPQCGAEIPWDGNAFRPFCSERCRLIDLGRWLGERYRAPAETVDDESVDVASSRGTDTD